MAKRIAGINAGMWRTEGMSAGNEEWVASNAGTTVVKIDRWAPSSKVCYVCGTVNPCLTLKQRYWECDCCHTILDRDTNAAINIKRLGLAQLGYSA